MKKSKFFLLQCKRAAKSYPLILSIFFVTVLSIALTAALLLNSYASDDNKKKVNIGVVNNSGEDFVNMGIFALKSMDDSRFSFDLIEMDEEQARTKLRSRELSGYVVIPHDYLHQIDRGENIPATYVSMRNADGFGTVMTNEMTDIISKAVTETQAAIYSMQDAAADYADNINMSEKIDMMNIFYVNAMLSRAKTYKLEELGIAENLSLPEYYLCGMIMLLLFLWGIAYSKLLIKKDNSLQRVLDIRGIGAFSQIIIEIMVFFLFTLVTMLIFAAAADILLLVKGAEASAYMGTGSCIEFVFKTAPVILLINTLQFILYECISGTIGAVLVQFIVTLGFGYISGFFYPSSFFPDAMRTAGNILPSGVGFSYLKNCLTDALSSADCITAAAYILLFTTAAVFIRRHRLRGSSL